MRRIWVGVMLAAGWMPLACAQGNDRGPIDVVVVSGQTQVPEERARTTRGQGAIVWRLQTPGYRFAPDGIVFDAAGSSRHDCRITANGRGFRCVKLGHVSGAEYKYDVKLVRDDGRPLEPLDPWIVND